MKKYIIYIGILAIGLALGWVLFGTSSSSTNTQEHNHELTETENQQWTCSMHPQIMQNEAGSCPICGMDLIPAASSSEGLSANQFNMTKNAMALANIETTIIQKSSAVSNHLILSGKIKENEKLTSIQTAHFGGRIEKLHINSTGETVRKGQLLALIYSPELVTAQKELLTALSMKASQPNLYKAVKNKLKLWKLSKNQIQKIESSKEVIPNFPVYANVSGIVTMKMIEEGNYIMEGSPLLKIANLSTVWAEFDAYEKQLSSIQKGAEISITSNAYPTTKIKATVSFIDPVLNTATRTVIIRAELNNKNGGLKPGMFVQGNLTIQMSNNTSLTVPKTAILWTGKRSIVYVKQLGDEPIFEMREVVLGASIGTNYEVLDGLNEFEEIVTNGTFTVDAAAQLQGKKSMMNKTGGKVMTGHENHTMDKSEQTSITMATFGVRGNCGMCKNTIEKAANSVEGVSKATWVKDKKMMMVSFDASKTTEMTIHNAIAASGYDTEKVKGSETAYNNLPGCCKYDHEMKMNQTSEINKEHSSHNH